MHWKGSRIWSLRTYQLLEPQVLTPSFSSLLTPRAFFFTNVEGSSFYDSESWKWRIEDMWKGHPNTSSLSCLVARWIRLTKTVLLGAHKLSEMDWTEKASQWLLPEEINPLADLYYRYVAECFHLPHLCVCWRSAVGFSPWLGNLHSMASAPCGVLLRVSESLMLVLMLVSGKDEEGDLDWAAAVN